MKIPKIAIISIALILSCNVHASLVSATYSTDNLVYTYVSPGAADTYGLGIHGVNLNTNVSVSYTYDNNPANATSVYSNPPSMNYEFHAPSYSASLMVNGVNSYSTTWSSISIINNAILPPESGIPQYWIDAGFPSELAGPVDILWMGGYSEDNDFGPPRNGLVFSIDFVDLGGDWLSSDTAIPAFAPDLASIDLAVLTIRQYENDALLFEAAGIVVNNITAVPEPATIWLLGAGLFGLVWLSRCREVA